MVFFSTNSSTWFAWLVSMNVQKKSSRKHAIESLVDVVADGARWNNYTRRAGAVVKIVRLSNQSSGASVGEQLA